MGIEEEIRGRLLRGYAPQQLVSEGYRKSTVYKVYDSVKLGQVPVTSPTWFAQNYNFHQLRYMPGQTIPISFTFRNNSQFDLYLYRIGIQPEWLRADSPLQEPKWFAQEVKELVKSGGQRWFSFTCQIPQGLSLGEYEIRFGMEGQYLPGNQLQIQGTQWSEPEIIQVKKPLTGISIFLSHSTEDIRLVRDLETKLDNEGVQVKIAEDRLEPGILLMEKFQRMITESTMLLALLTEGGVRSQWVLEEVNYASKVNKPMILLKEKGVQISSPREWVEFSKYDPPDITLRVIMQSIQAVQKRVAPNQAVSTIIGIAIMALLFDVLSNGSKK